jgi:putative ABC transport system permease protein
MDAVRQDLRFAVRQIQRRPSTAILAIATLALGIGANSTIFSVVNAVLLKPLPVRDPGSLVTVAMWNARFNAAGAQPSTSAYFQWRERRDIFAGMGAAASATALVETSEAAKPLRWWRVSADLLPMLGVSPAAGRVFSAEEDRPGATPVAMLASGDRSLLGSTVKIDGKPHTVIGILPPGFHLNGRPAGVYTPIAMSPNSKEWIAVDIYARLSPGVTTEQATAALKSHRAEQGPFPWQAQVWRLRDFQVRDVRLSMWVLLGAVGLVLLIACANIASLLLARATARQREFFIRSSLGAERPRLVRQLLTECGLLAIAGGIAGVAVAAVSVKVVPLLAHERLPGLIEQARVDGRVLLFSIGLSLLTGLLFGAAPALATGRAPRRRQFEWIVIGETALAVMLAIGATLLVKTFFYLRDVAPGFRVDRLVIATVNSERGRFKTPQQCLDYYGDVLRRVRAIPGVRAATYASAMPLTGDNLLVTLAIEGHQFARPQDYPPLWHRTVERDYFRTMEIPLKRGRFFDERDDLAASRKIIVNEAFVRRFWPGQDPIGKRLGGVDSPVYEVIGVAGDVRHQDSTRDAAVEIFFHQLQSPTMRATLALRVDSGAYRKALLVEPALRSAVAGADPGQPVTRVAELQRMISDRVAPKRLSAQQIAVIASLAAVLAAIGIYGVLAFAVTQRTRELGIRIAVGAHAGNLMRMVIGRSLVLGAAGVVIGIVGALGLTRFVKTLLYGVSATEPLTYIAAGAGALLLAALASAAPAWRASQVDPIRVLRHD